MSQVLTTFTPTELRSLIRAEIDSALEDHAGKPELLDRTRLAQALCCSPSHVDVLRKRGMPQILVGDSPRFVLADVLAWLRSAGA